MDRIGREEQKTRQERKKKKDKEATLHRSKVTGTSGRRQKKQQSRGATYGKGFRAEMRWK